MFGPDPEDMSGDDITDHDIVAMHDPDNDERSWEFDDDNGDDNGDE